MSDASKWCFVKLGDIAEVVSGKNQKHVETSNGQYPIYGSGGIFGYADEYLCEAGTTVIGRKGTINSPIFVNQRFWNVDTAFGISSFAEINSRYVHYFCTSFNFTELDKSTTIPSLAKRDILKIDIPLPPVNEQHRIVTKIEALFTELDKGIESLLTAREQLKVYRQALLKHAFEGKLTEQWRKENADKLETAPELLARIQQEREARYQRQLSEWEEAVAEWEINGKVAKRPVKPKQHKKLERPDYNETGIYYKHLPDTWLLVRIGDVSSVGTGVTPLKSRKEYYENGTVPWVTSGALNDSCVTQASGHITELALRDTNLRLYPVNTLLMAMYGEGKTRGKCSELRLSAATNQAIAAMVQEGLEEKTRQLLKWFLIKNYTDIRRKSSGGVQPNLNLGIVENTVFPLCPLNEMEVIVDKLERQLSVTDEIDRTINVQLQKSEALRQSILKKAFSGQLVPQDPNDEPASELLKRIAVEKAELAAAAKVAKSEKKKPITNRARPRQVG